MREIKKAKKGDELPPGVIKMVKVYVAIKRKLKIGDKMAFADASSRLPLGMLPVKCLNGRGWHASESGGNEGSEAAEAQMADAGTDLASPASRGANSRHRVEGSAAIRSASNDSFAPGIGWADGQC